MKPLYDFLWSIEKLPTQKRPEALTQLSNAEFKLLKHAYFNKSMFKKDWMREYIADGVDINLVKANNLQGLEGIIDYASSNYDIDILANNILVYLYNVSTTYGSVQSGMAAKAIFRMKKIVGITKADVQKEEERRNESR